MASGSCGHWARHDRVSSSASHGGLDARICAVVAARPSARSWDAEYRAARAAGADPGAPAQAGSAASTATVCPGCASAHAAATAAPIETPPTAIGPSRAASSSARQIAGDQPIRFGRRSHQQRAHVLQRGGKCAMDVVVVGAGSGQQHRRDTAQIDSHALILPGNDQSPKSRLPQLASGNFRVYRVRWHG